MAATARPPDHPRAFCRQVHRRGIPRQSINKPPAGRTSRSNERFGAAVYHNTRPIRTATSPGSTHPSISPSSLSARCMVLGPYGPDIRLVVTIDSLFAAARARMPEYGMHGRLATDIIRRTNGWTVGRTPGTKPRVHPSTDIQILEYTRRVKVARPCMQ